MDMTLSSESAKRICIQQLSLAKWLEQEQTCAISMHTKAGHAKQVLAITLGAENVACFSSVLLCMTKGRCLNLLHTSAPAAFAACIAPRANSGLYKQ